MQTNTILLFKSSHTRVIGGASRPGLGRNPYPRPGRKEPRARQWRTRHRNVLSEFLYLVCGQGRALLACRRLRMYQRKAVSGKPGSQAAGEDDMAKGQLRSNREKKKPKAEKNKSKNRSSGPARRFGSREANGSAGKKTS
jgi:hypothetical protein